MDDAVTSPATPVAAKPPGARRRGAKAQYPDRIRISAEAVQRLASWAEQIGGRLRGVRITRSDLVNFILLGHAEALTAVEMKELRGRYFDEVKFVLWAVEEQKAAETRGEDITVAEIMERNRPESLGVQRAPKRGNMNRQETAKTPIKTHKNSHVLPTKNH